MSAYDRSVSPASTKFWPSETVQPRLGSWRSERHNRGGLASWQQKRVTEFIADHVAENLSLAVLAGIAGLSVFHFARAFKQSLGMPPHRYHIARRVDRAKVLLAEPSSSVTEIAFEVGFQELSSFTAAFRRFSGVSPSQYRRSLA